MEKNSIAYKNALKQVKTRTVNLPEDTYYHGYQDEIRNGDIITVDGTEYLVGTGGEVAGSFVYDDLVPLLERPEYSIVRFFLCPVALIYGDEKIYNSNEAHLPRFRQTVRHYYDARVEETPDGFLITTATGQVFSVKDSEDVGNVIDRRREGSDFKVREFLIPDREDSKIVLVFNYGKWSVNTLYLSYPERQRKLPRKQKKKLGARYWPAWKKKFYWTRAEEKQGLHWFF